MSIESERGPDAQTAHDLEAHSVDERDLRCREVCRQGELVSLPVDPGDLDGPEQPRMEVASRNSPEPAFDERRGLEDDVVRGNQSLRAELVEKRQRRRVVFVALAEQREERGGVD